MKKINDIDNVNDNNINNKYKRRINSVNILIIAIILIQIVLIGVLENIFSYNYMIKSGVKAFMFLLTYIICIFVLKFSKKYIKSKNSKNIFKDIRKNIRENIRYYLKILLLQVFVFLSIVIGYLIFLKYIDIADIKKGLAEKNITKGNCIYVYTYIILFNSLFEELFFRGFIYLKLDKILKKAKIFSAFCFSVYHIAILSDFVMGYMMALLILGLFIIGMFFNKLDEKQKQYIQAI